MAFLYTCLTWLYVIPLVLILLVRALFGDYEQLERLGLRLPKIDGSRRTFWFVASSVGEVNIAVKLINRLRQQEAVGIILTVTTPTGRKQAQTAGCAADIICYHPFDVVPCVNRFLKVFQPEKILLIETELWPTLMKQAFSLNVQIVQVSGRISTQSLQRYLPFRPLFAPLLQHVKPLLMQSTADATRIVRLGGRREVVTVLGSPKSDYTAPPEEKLKSIRDYLSVWSKFILLTCGSTRPDEEKIILDAFAPIRTKFPNLRLVLAPRHLQRGEEVTKEISQGALRFTTRSSNTLTEADVVLLLDTLGELNLFYHLSHIAFVGGTLVPLGGHSLLEPALAGCPVLHGPYCFNQQPGLEMLRRFDLGIIVKDSAELQQQVKKLLTLGNPRQVYKERVAQLRKENASIVDNYVQRILV